MSKYREISIIMMFFFFAIIVNAIFIIISSRSHPGIVTNNPYQKGMNYNKVLAEQTIQDNLNYHIETSLDKSTSCLSVYLNDKETKAIDDAIIHLKMVRPTNDGQDLELQVPHVKGNLYQECIKFPQPGQWHLRLHIAHGNNHLYHQEKISLAR